MNKRSPCSSHLVPKEFIHLAFEELTLHYPLKHHLLFDHVRFPFLKHLTLLSSRHRILPSSIQHLAQLETLCVHGLGSQWPQNFLRFPRLKLLRLKKSFPQHLYHEVPYLPQLQTLDLSENNLKVLPPWIKELRQLRTLILTKNQLTSFPQEILTLPHLQRLVLDENEILYQNLSIHSKKLNHLSLDGNPMTEEERHHFLRFFS